MKYCFDTSALIEPWVRHYPPDVFRSVWDKLAEVVEAGTVRAPMEVMRELERQSDPLFEWVTRIPALFVELDTAHAVRCKDIVNAFPNLVKPNSPKSQADPFVIGMAELAGVPVVTYETRAKANAAPKIPNVCDARGVPCIGFVDVLRAEGFRF
jgi:hypothetical protein